MKWKHIVIGGAFIGAFSLGSFLAPIDGPLATTFDKVSSGKLPVVQTVSGNAASQQGQNNYTCPLTGEEMGSGTGMGMGKLFAGSMPKVIAGVLGMTEDELQAERAGGKSVADLAKEKGVSVDKVKDEMVKERKAQLAQLVKDGKITQEQMDGMLKNMETMMDQAIQRDTVGPMNGRGGKMGMGNGGRGCGGMGNQQQTETGSGV